MDSNLGGGDHGYLGLVLTDAEYLAVPGVGAGNLFQGPVYPGPLTILPTATQLQAVQLRENHRADIKAYHQCQNVEKSLQSHLQLSIGSKYINAFIDNNTALLNVDIPGILQHLFLRYG